MKKILITFSIFFVILFNLYQNKQDSLESKKSLNNELLYINTVCVKDICEDYHNKKFTIPTDSMFPLFKIGETYEFSSVTQFTVLNRFDVVAFRLNVNDRFPSFEIKKSCENLLNIKNKCAKESSIHYTKRVVGLPNDTIQMVNGRLKINGVLSKYTKIKTSDNIINLGEKNLKSKDKKGGFTYYIEKFNNSEHIIAMADKYSNKLLNTEPYVLGDNEYFMMGDNRVFSSDSRTFGIINRENITYVYYSEQNPLNTLEYAIISKNK